MKGTRRFKFGLTARVEDIDVIVERWEESGYDVEVHVDTRRMYSPTQPERRGWGGADFDPHIGSRGQRFGRD